MRMFQAVTLNSDAPIKRGQCARGGNSGWPPMRAIAKIAAAPAATHRLRKVHTGISASAIFIRGQLQPHPNVSMSSNAQVERGRVWRSAFIA